MRAPLWLDIQVGEQSGRSVQATVSLSTCRNCGRIKVASDPCGFDHLAALAEFGRDLERLGYERPVGGTATPADVPACEHFTGCICLADGRDPTGCRWRRPAPADQGEKP